MPFIDVKLSLELDKAQKSELQTALSDAVSSAFSKPKTYIMSNIEGSKSLFMADKKLEKGAYVSISLFGSASKPACQALTKNICDILNSKLSVSGENVYVTYHPLDLWGWRGMMF